VSVDMGVPNFDPHALPMVRRRGGDYSLRVEGVDVDIGAVSMGNRMSVLQVRCENRAGGAVWA